MKDENENLCPQCGNHCPSDQLRCGRGVRYFEENNMEYRRSGHERGEHRHRQPDMPEGRPGEGCRRNHFPQNDFAEPRSHGEERPPFRHHRREIPHDPDDLEGMFAACAREMRHGRKRRFGSTQDRIIRILDENGGTMGQKALQQLLDIQPGSISEILAKMEEKELISRSKDSDDRRAFLITLQAKESAEDDHPEFFSMLDMEEKETLRALLQKILDSRKPERPESDDR